MDRTICGYCHSWLGDDIHAENKRLRAELAEAKRAVEVLLDFASTVAPGSSWWDDTWPEHDAAMAGGE